MAASFSRTNFIHGGTCIFVKTELTSVCVKKYDYLIIEKDIEFSIIKTNNLFIIAIYRSPLGNFDTFLTNLDILLTSLYANLNSKIVLCGDFNINFLKESKNRQQLLNLVSTFNLVQCIFNATRVTKKTSSCIDNFFTNLENCSARIIDDINLSDHYPQVLNLNIQKTSKPQNFHYKRKISPRSIQTFTDSLAKIDWNSILDQKSLNVSKKFDLFMLRVSDLFEKCFPEKKVLYREKSNKWLTKGIKISCKNKRFLIYMKKFFNENFFEAYVNKYCQILKKVTIMARKKHLENKIVNSTCKSKTVWDIIKNEKCISPKKKFSIKTDYCSTPITDLTQIADVFNNQFLNEHNQVSIDFPNVLAYLNKTKINIGDSFFFQPIDVTEILSTISNLKNKDSSGIDGISMNLIKNIAGVICAPLCRLFNSSLEEGIFPEVLKRAVVIPVHKKGNAASVENYRPISLLSSFSKILEKIVYTRLMNFLQKMKILTPCQHGFLVTKSTTTAVADLINIILNELDNSKKVTSLSCDLKKAFDSVNHEILLEKLSFYGIRGNALSWFTSYLTNRTQCTRIDGFVDSDDESKFNKVFSKWGIISKGVPQGSVLGPLLFLIHINDLPVNVPHTEPIMFADDTTFIISGKNADEIFSNVNRSLANIKEWCSVNHIDVNFEKTFCLNFSLVEHDDTNLPPAIYDVHHVNSLKHLGFKIDNCLKWKSHVEYISNKLIKTCYALRVLSAKKISRNILKIFYSSCFESILRYGIIFWGQSTKWHDVFIIQKYAIRLISRIKQGESCKLSFVHLEIMTLTSLYIFEVLTFVHKNLHRFTMFNGSTRQSQSTLVLPKHATSAFEKNVFYIGAKMFNRLSCDARSWPHGKFKNCLKKFLIKKPYYSINEFLSDDAFI